MKNIILHFLYTTALTVLSVTLFVCNAYAADVTIILKGKIKLNSSLQVYSFKNLEEKVKLEDITIELQNEVNLQLDHPENKYYFFTIDGKTCEALINATHKNTIIFDFDENDWVKLTNGRKTDPVLFSYYAQFRKYDNRNVKDSASYIDYHLDFMNKLDLSPLSQDIELNDVQNYARKISFSIFCNTVMGKQLFTVTQDFNTGINRNLKYWANLESLKLKQASYYDLSVIRNFHIFFSHEIFPYNSGELTFYEIINFAEKWLQKMDYNSEVKNYILGDIIQFHTKANLKVDQQLIDKLEEIYNADSIGRHAEFIKKLSAQYNAITNFNVHAIDLNGQKFELSHIKEKIIFVDFWATWCGPCIKEEPFVEKLKSDYKDKVAFVKISIDEDYDKWQTYISNDSELSYILAQDEARGSTLLTFNLLAIPKFIIMDNKGKIIDPAAPRPSEVELREVLDELLKE